MQFGLSRLAYRALWWSKSLMCVEFVSKYVCAFVFMCVFVFVCILHLCAIWASTTSLQGALMGSGRGRLAKPMFLHLYFRSTGDICWSRNMFQSWTFYLDTLHFSDGVREGATSETNVIKPHKSLFPIMNSFFCTWMLLHLYCEVHMLYLLRNMFQSWNCIVLMGSEGGRLAKPMLSNLINPQTEV